MSDFIKGLWPRSLFTWLGLILGTLSVLKLIIVGFDYGTGPTFTLMLAYYENLLSAAFGSWAEPFIKASLAEVRYWVGWDLHLHAHWKHVFVLMGIYLLRSSSYALGIGRTGSGTFRLIWGLAVALVSSIAAGSVVPVQNDAWSSFLVAAIPVAGITLFDAGRSAWDATWDREREARRMHGKTLSWSEYFVSSLYRSSQRALVGIAILVGGLQVPAVQRLPSPGLAMLLGLIVFLAVYWLLVGWADIKDIREDGENWVAAYSRSAARLGLAMIAVFFWVGLFIAANAGLRFYGL